MGLPEKGPGRPVGSVNKISTKFVETMRKHGVNIAEELLDRYNDARADGKDELAVRILVEMAQYVYPKLKSTEHVHNAAIEQMSVRQKLEAFKEAVKVLEIEAAKDLK